MLDIESRFHENFLIKTLLGLLIVLFSPQVQSAEREDGFDYRASAGVRTRPLGAAVSVDGGYDLPIWGNWRDPSNFMYGYLRPGVNLSTSGTVSVADASISLAPVSFLEFKVGRQTSWRLKDSSVAANCALFQCDGSLTADYGTINLRLAFGKLFLSSTVDRRDYTSSADSEFFYDDSQGVIGAPGRDRVFSHQHILGYRFGDENRPRFVGINARRNEAETSTAFSQRLSFMAGETRGPWRFVAMGGLYESSISATAPTFAIQAEYMFKQGLLLQ